MARIAVVGAGIAGLATAVALQQLGYDVTVIEERTDTSSGAGISIWPNALAALDHIGLGDSVREAGGRVTAGAMRWRDGSWLRHPSPERLVKALGEPLVVVHRSALTDILAGALVEGTIQNGVAARDMVLTPDGVEITLSDSTTRAAAAVIGADGTRSVVARHLNGVMETATSATRHGVGLPPVRSTPNSPARPAIVAAASIGTAGTGPHVLVRRAPDRRAPECATTSTTAIGHRDVVRAVRGRRRPPDPPPLDGAHDLSTAFGFPRRRRVAVRESAVIGRIVNLRPAFLSAAASRAFVVMPEAMLTRHLATVASRSAFMLPSPRSDEFSVRYRKPPAG